MKKTTFNESLVVALGVIVFLAVVSLAELLTWLHLTQISGMHSVVIDVLQQPVVSNHWGKDGRKLDKQNIF